MVANESVYQEIFELCREFYEQPSYSGREIQLTARLPPLLDNALGATKKGSRTLPCFRAGGEKVRNKSNISSRQKFSAYPYLTGCCSSLPTVNFCCPAGGNIEDSKSGCAVCRQGRHCSSSKEEKEGTSKWWRENCPDSQKHRIYEL